MLQTDHPERSPTLRIAVFAGMADLVGGRTVEMPWSGGTVADARRVVAERHPPAATLLARSAFAVGPFALGFFRCSVHGGCGFLPGRFDRQGRGARGPRVLGQKALAHRNGGVDVRR